MTEVKGAFKTLYSITIFIIVFSILNFYIKQMKEEKAWRRNQAEFKELQKVQIKAKKELKFYQDFFQCEKTQQVCCKVSELFLLK